MTQHDTAVKAAWAEGVMAFAACLLLTVGTFQVLQGMAAVLNGDFFVAVRGNTYGFDLTAWGWIHIVIGLAAAAIGWGLLRSALWARLAGIWVAIIQGIAQFMFLPYYPFWSIVILAIDVMIIWALASSTSQRARA